MPAYQCQRASSRAVTSPNPRGQAGVRGSRLQCTVAARFAQTLALLGARVAFVSLLALLNLGTAQAQQDAFSIEVAVSGRSQAERDDAYGRGLRQILLDNSGDKTLLNRDEVRAALLDAESYVETFRFRSPEPGTLIPVDTPVTERVRDTGEATGLLLVRFDRDRVLALIAGNEPVEDDDTPTVNPLVNVDKAVLWLLIDDTDRAIRGTSAAAAKVRDRLREIAGGGGVTLVFPSDESIDNSISDDAIRALNLGPIRSASLRYATDVVVIGHVQRAGLSALDVESGTDTASADSRVRQNSAEGRAPRPGNRETAAGWIGTWSKSSRDRSDTTTTQGETLDEVLRAGMAWLSGDPTIGQRADYVYGGGGSSTEGLLRIDGLGDLRDYARVSELLSTVPGVSGSWPREISGDVVIFSVVPRNALSAVASALDRTGWLRRGRPSAASGQSEIARNAELVYDVVR